MFDYELVIVIDPASITETLSSMEFIETYGPAYHETWPEAMNSIMDSPADCAIVHLLMDEYFDNGCFNDPVRVQLAQSDIEDHYTYESCVTNGMHRTTTSYIYGLPITFTYFYSPPEVRPTDEFTIAKISFEDMDNTFEVYDEVSSWLRSFRLPQGQWVEGWTSTHEDGKIEVWFDEKLNHKMLSTTIEKICSNEHLSKYNWEEIELLDMCEEELYPPDER